jgi:hypothetical protein
MPESRRPVRKALVQAQRGNGCFDTMGVMNLGNDLDTAGQYFFCGERHGWFL